MIDSIAIEFLQQSDQILGQVIVRVGECQLNRVQKDSDLLEEIARAIIYQQISLKAAAKIYQRFLQLYTDSNLSAMALLETPEEKLRGIGISRPKIRYLKDLAEKIIAGLPTLEELEVMKDEAIIKTLTEVKGVGRWTVQMLLIFRLNRLDVLPVDDLGLRKGIKLVYGLDDLPDRNTIESFGERWKPYRSIASWYLWRSLD